MLHSRPTNSQPPAQQGQALQQPQPASQAAQVPSYKAAATKRLPPRSSSVDSADFRRTQQPASASASPAPAAARAAAPRSAATAAHQHLAAGPSPSSSIALPAPPPPNILRRPQAAEDSMSAQFLPPGPPLTPSSTGTAPAGAPAASMEHDEAASLPSSRRGSDARSMQPPSRSELGSPVAGQVGSSAGPWGPRTLADAVRQGPQEGGRSSSQPAQQQQQPKSPAVQTMGHYQSAVLGLGRPHPKSPQPAPAPLVAPAALQQRKAQQAPSAATAAAAAEQPLKVQEQREAKAEEPAQLPGVPEAEQKAPPQALAPAQTPKAKPAAPQFTLSAGDFPTLGAAASERRRSSKGDVTSPGSSAAVTPKVANRKAPAPAFSVASSPAVPRWGPAAAKARQASAQACAPPHQCLTLV